MEFKVGDRVRIREDLSVEEKYDETWVTKEMLGYRGEIATIEWAEDDYYRIDLDGGEYAWVEEFFEKVTIITLENLEQRIEKLEKEVFKPIAIHDRPKENVSNFEKMEQNTIEKRENEPIYERNERFAKILKKELERNAIIFNEPKPSLLTEDERVILMNLDKEMYKWIAREENNKLRVYWGKPTKKNGLYWDFTCGYENFYMYNHLFQFIKWTDSEPYNIEELLKGDSGNEN